MDSKLYASSIQQHYIDCWKNKPTTHKWEKGPVHELPCEFEVLRFSPTTSRSIWIYATCGMSISQDIEPLELHIFSNEKHDFLIELLTIVAHCHRNIAILGHGHTINFGQRWWLDSSCQYGLISLPYLDGPFLEWLVQKGTKTRFLWLIPITKSEVEYKKRHGLDALEELFDRASFNYLDPYRKSVV